MHAVYISLKKQQQYFQKQYYNRNCKMNKETEAVMPPSAEEIERRRKLLDAPKDEIALLEERKEKQRMSNLEHPLKLDQKLSEERKKQLEVPKDEMALIEEKEKQIQNKEPIIEDKSQMRDQKAELSPKIQQDLAPVREEPAKESKDLLDLEAEPLRVEPKMEQRQSQEQLRRQMYQQRQEHRDAPHELQRKEQLTPRTAEKITEELRQQDNNKPHVSFKKQEKSDMPSKTKKIEKKTSVKRQTQLPIMRNKENATKMA